MLILNVDHGKPPGVATFIQCGATIRFFVLKETNVTTESVRILGDQAVPLTPISAVAELTRLLPPPDLALTCHDSGKRPVMTPTSLMTPLEGRLSSLTSSTKVGQRIKNN